MTVDVTKLQFYSGYPIDKIFSEGTTSITVVACSDPTTAPSIATKTVSNSYGIAGFVTASYTVDGSNYYGQDTSFNYWDATTASVYPEITLATACDNNTIYFMVQSLYRPSSLTVTINYAVDSLT
jgi:hypothetical protein